MAKGVWYTLEQGVWGISYRELYLYNFPKYKGFEAL